MSRRGTPEPARDRWHASLSLCGVRCRALGRRGGNHDGSMRDRVARGKDDFRRGTIGQSLTGGMMNDEAAFVRSILSAPDDDAPRLVFADWLEEHGRPKTAAWLRWWVGPLAHAVLPTFRLQGNARAREFIEPLWALHEKPSGLVVGAFILNLSWRHQAMREDRCFRGQSLSATAHPASNHAELAACLCWLRLICKKEMQRHAELARVQSEGRSRRVKVIKPQAIAAWMQAMAALQQAGAAWWRPMIAKRRAQAASWQAQAARAQANAVATDWRRPADGHLVRHRLQSAFLAAGSLQWPNPPESLADDVPPDTAEQAEDESP
jgi:uncharacterized protein (TIGR02996 family)